MGAGEFFYVETIATISTTATLTAERERERGRAVPAVAQRSAAGARAGAGGGEGVESKTPTTSRNRTKRHLSCFRPPDPGHARPYREDYLQVDLHQLGSLHQVVDLVCECGRDDVWACKIRARGSVSGGRVEAAGYNKAQGEREGERRKGEREGKRRDTGRRRGMGLGERTVDSYIPNVGTS